MMKSDYSDARPKDPRPIIFMIPESERLTSAVTWKQIKDDDIFKLIYKCLEAKQPSFIHVSKEQAEFIVTHLGRISARFVILTDIDRGPDADPLDPYWIQVSSLIDSVTIDNASNFLALEESLSTAYHTKARDKASRPEVQRVRQEDPIEPEDFVVEEEE